MLLDNRQKTPTTLSTTERTNSEFVVTAAVAIAELRLRLSGIAFPLEKGVISYAVRQTNTFMSIMMMMKTRRKN